LVCCGTIGAAGAAGLVVSMIRDFIEARLAEAVSAGSVRFASRVVVESLIVYAASANLRESVAT
jgi:hypothetical protein